MAKSILLPTTAPIQPRRLILMRSPVTLSILALLLMLPVTLWITDHLQKTLIEISWLLAGIVTFCLIGIACASVKILRKLVALSVLGGLLVVLIVPACVNWYVRPQQPEFLMEIYRNIPHINGFAAHPNTLAVSLLSFLPFFFGLLLFSVGKMPALEWFSMSIVVLMGLGFLLLTQSVGAWAGLAVALLLLVLLRWRRSGWLLIVAICAALAYLMIFIQPVALRAFTVHELIEPLRLRSELWTRAVYLIGRFPITGIGMGSFEEAVDTLYPIFITPPASLAHPRPHNVYLQMGVDLGLLGFAAWLFILASAFFAARQIYAKGREQCDPWLIGLGAGLLCSQVGLMVHGLVDNVAPAFWPVWGLAIGCQNLFIKEHLAALHIPPRG